MSYGERSIDDAISMDCVTTYTYSDDSLEDSLSAVLYYWASAYCYICAVRAVYEGAVDVSYTSVEYFYAVAVAYEVAD